jgi:hypothetical protein
LINVETQRAIRASFNDFGEQGEVL